jgi:hypothetical protein
MAEKVLSIAERRNKYAVPVLENSLAIIKYLSEQAVPMTQAQISESLNAPGSHRVSREARPR